jgi:hypothetical protein
MKWAISSEGMHLPYLYGYLYKLLLELLRHPDSDRSIREKSGALRVSFFLFFISLSLSLSLSLFLSFPL